MNNKKKPPASHEAGRGVGIKVLLSGDELCTIICALDMWSAQMIKERYRFKWLFLTTRKHHNWALERKINKTLEKMKEQRETLRRRPEKICVTPRRAKVCDMKTSMLKDMVKEPGEKT